MRMAASVAATMAAQGSPVRTFEQMAACISRKDPAISAPVGVAAHEIPPRATHKATRESQDKVVHAELPCDEKLNRREQEAARG